MENFDKKIREQGQAFRRKPSDRTWDRLHDRLEAKHEQRKVFRMGTLVKYAAAIFVLGMAGSYFYLDAESYRNDTTIVMESLPTVQDQYYVASLEQSVQLRYKGVHKYDKKRGVKTELRVRGFND